MRLPLFTALSAALLLSALPAVAHDWSEDRDDSVVVERICPTEVVTKVTRVVHARHVVRHHAVAHCPVVAKAPVTHHRRRVVATTTTTRIERRWSYDVFHVDRGCFDGDGRMHEDHGMACRIDGMHHDDVGAFRHMYREEEDQWSSSERHEHWRGPWRGGQPSATDRYGYLTWPGKVWEGPPMGPPPPDAVEVHP